MSHNLIHYRPGGTIDETLNLKANSMRIKNNLDVSLINGMPYIGGTVNVGTANQLIQTDPTGTFPEWTSDIKVVNAEISAQVILNGDSGSNGEIIIKSGGVPVWSTPTFSLPSITPGTPYQILITDSLGAVAWSSDIQVDNCNITDQLSFSSDSGLDGQIIIKSGGVPIWGSPTFTLPSIPVGTPRQLLQTNAGGTSAEWTSNVQVAASNFTGNMQMSGVSGVTGQALVKTSAFGQAWGKIGSQNISPGTANYVMTTDATGTTSNWTNALSVASLNLTNNLSFNSVNGSAGQYVKKSGGAQLWSNIVAGDITPGSADQLLVTNSAGTAAVWSNVTVPKITPGLAFQVPQTNSAGTAVEWTSDLGVDSVLFTGSTSNLQSSLSRYYNDTVSIPVYAAPVSGAMIASQALSLNCNVTIIGSLVTIIIPAFTLFNFINGVVSPGYVLLRLPANLLPAVITAPSNNRQAAVPFISYTDSTQNVAGGICSVYNSYFGLGTAASCIEFNLNDGAISYDPASYHGEGFTTGGVNTMYLKAPVTISYILA